MLNKTIAICLVVVLGNAFGMKLHTQYTEMLNTAGERVTVSVGQAGGTIR